MNIYNIADVLTGLFEAIMMFMLLESFCAKREKLPHLAYGAGIIALTVLINISNNIFSFGILNAVGMAVSIFICSNLYKGSIKTKALISVLGFLFIGVIEIMVLFILSSVLQISATEIVDNQSHRLLGIILSKALTFAMLKAVCLKLKKQKTHMGTYYWVFFFIIFANLILAVFLIFKLSYDNSTIYMHNLSVICSFGLLFSTFFSLYLYEHLAEQAELISKQRQFEEQIKSQSKHLDEILVTQNQLRKFKHDFSNHLLSLSAYFKKNDCAGGIEYINNITGEIKDAVLVIDTGNTALDTIVGTKKVMAESKGIEFTSNIQIPEMIPIEATDICVIFGNALDNAIEACEKLSDSKKKIALSIIYENDSIVCKIKNSAPKQKGNILETTKKDKENHGFGLENINTALSKYKHVFQIDNKDGEFVLFFVIFTCK